MIELKRKENESYDDYSSRLYRNKSLYDLKNEEIADIIKAEFEITKDESAIRKDMASYIRGYDKGYERGLSDVEIKSERNSLIPKSHLERLKEVTGEYSIRKRDMELERLELAKLKREITPAILMTEQYVEYLNENGITIPSDIKFIPTKVGSCVIKSLPSDLHIGMVVDEDYNQYDYSVAQRRMRQYTQSILDYAKLFNANTVSITTMGDLVEATELRGNQKFDCEFHYAEQVSMAQDLIMEHIMTILNEGYKVDLSGVYGNHDRMVGSKNDNIDSSNATYVILENIKKTFEYMEKFSGKKFENISFVQYDNKYKYHVDEYYGFRIRYQHGDNDSKADTSKIEKYNGTDDDSYDALVFGHLHHYRHIQLNRHEFELYCPCLQGSNEYAKNQVKSTSNAGQAIIVIRDNGEVIPMNINLQ